jgi:hypothetical protein
MDGNINSGCTPDDTEDTAVPFPYYFMDGNINSGCTPDDTEEDTALPCPYNTILG